LCAKLRMRGNELKPWADRDELLHRCRGPRRNYLCQLLWLSLIGFERGGGQILGFSVDSRRHPYNTPIRKSFAFASIYLSASIMYCNLWGIAICFFAKITRVASCHLLLYVVYTCQKLFNFINAFACYKQKCKLAPFNLAHPVYWSNWQTRSIMPRQQDYTSRKLQHSNVIWANRVSWLG